MMIDLLLLLLLLFGYGLCVYCFGYINSGLQLQADEQQIMLTDLTQLLSWEELGDKPMFGDMGDQGAVDIAIKIKDLEIWEAQAQTTTKRLYYRDKIREEAERLVEITLLQVAPPPGTPEPRFADDNVISYDEFKAHKKHDD